MNSVYYKVKKFGMQMEAFNSKFFFATRLDGIEAELLISIKVIG